VIRSGDSFVMQSRVWLSGEKSISEPTSPMTSPMTATLVARSALLRRESRGPHYRTDFPTEGGDAFVRKLVWRWEKKGCASSWAPSN